MHDKYMLGVAAVEERLNREELENKVAALARKVDELTAAREATVVRTDDEILRGQFNRELAAAGTRTRSVWAVNQANSFLARSVEASQRTTAAPVSDVSEDEQLRAQFNEALGVEADPLGPRFLHGERVR